MRVSDEPNIDDGWEELLEESSDDADLPRVAPKAAAPPSRPSQGSVIPTPPKLPAPPKLGAPKLGIPKLPTPPKLGAPKLRTPKPETPKLGAPKRSASQPDTPKLGAPKPSEGSTPPRFELRVPGPHAASPKLGAPAPAPSQPAAPPPAAALDLPPPPEFLAWGNSAELPLENAARFDTAQLSTIDMATALAEAAAAAEPTPEPTPEPAPADSLELHIDLEPGNSGVATGDQFDIDVSDDVLPRVSPRHAEPEAPRASTARAEPLPQATARAAAVAPSPRPRPAPFAAALPSKRGKSLLPWVGVGAGVALVISLLAFLSRSDSTPEPDATTGATEPVAASTKPARTFRADTPDDPPPDAAKPETAKPETAKPETAKPETAKPEPSTPTVSKPDAPATSVITVARDDTDYRRAAAEYEQTGTQASLLAMATTACAMGDGPRARAAFRKLVGRTLRSEAILACRSSHVDVSAKVDGYTGPELLSQARSALAQGDAKTAFDKAHASNKVERSSKAVLVKGLAACQLGDGDQATRLMPHVAKSARSELRDGCKAVGVELPK